MTEKMLELAEKLEQEAHDWERSANEPANWNDKYRDAKMVMSNGVMNIAHAIRATFTAPKPRDWREDCVVQPSHNSCWDVVAPTRRHFLSAHGRWCDYGTEPIPAMCATGSHNSESRARAALAACTTPYPGYKENTVDVATRGDEGDGENRAAWRMRMKIKTAEPMYIYRVIADGKICERLELIRCSAGGWKRFRSEDIGEFSTREWYPCTCPIDALAHYINQRARRMVAATENTRRTYRDQIENATNTIQNHSRAERSRQELKDARMCGY